MSDITAAQRAQFDRDRHAGEDRQKAALVAGVAEPQPRAGALRCGGLVSWLAARIDRFAEYPAEDFERKCDAITRTITTVTFTLCCIAVLTAAAIQWLLAS